MSFKNRCNFKFLYFDRKFRLYKFVSKRDLRENFIHSVEDAVTQIFNEKKKKI